MTRPGTLDLEAFAHVVAHDLSAPLRGMSIHLKLLAKDLADGHASQATQRIDLLQQRLRRMDEMLRRVRHFSKVHAAGDGPQVVELGALVAEALEHIDVRDAVIDCAGSAEVQGAPLLVLTVLQELIRNAIEHHDGTPTVTIRVGPGMLTVTDDGPGFTTPPDALFELFSSAGAHVLDGAGSGLALCRYIARHLDGELTLSSPAARGRGAQATLRLPPA